jgi:hypothetical protein
MYQEIMLKRDSRKKYSKGEKRSRFNKLTTRISPGGNRFAPNRQIWKKVVRQLAARSFGNMQSNGVCLCHRSESENTWWKSMDFE